MTSAADKRLVLQGLLNELDDDYESKLPTVAEFRPAVEAVATPSCRVTYKTGWDRLVNDYGSRKLNAVKDTELEGLRNRIKTEVGAAKVADAAERGRPLHSADPDAHGHGAAENFVRASRLYFRVAADQHGIPDPAAKLKVIARPDGPRRALSDLELGDVVFACTELSDDPELDGLLYDWLRHTAARRESVLHLRLCDLDLAQGWITWSGKGGKTCRLPMAKWLIRRLLAFARSRGAVTPTDRVFRSREGVPITRKRFNVIFDRLDAFTDWSEAINVGPHWIRHTTLTDVNKVAGGAVSNRYAGHAKSALGTTGKYFTVTDEDLVAAYETLFGSRDAPRDPG